MNRLLRILQRLVFPTKLDTEISRVEAAMKRCDAEITEKTRIWSDNDWPCCPDCAFPELSLIAEKMVRQQKVLKALYAKRSKMPS